MSNCFFSDVQLSHIGAPHVIDQHLSFSQAPLKTCKAERPRHTGHIEQPVQGLTPSQLAGRLFHMGSCTSGLQYLPSKEHEIGIDNGFKVIICREGLIPIHDQLALVRFYESAFENLQQVNCRILAKAYIKLVEPRKQVHYPYNGRKAVGGKTIQFDPEETKPPWWPSQVQHREPDHLPKVERIRLLVHILRDLRISHGITVNKLKEADWGIRYQMRPQGRLHFLDELYQVREQEEWLLDRQADRHMVERTSYSNFSETAGKPGRTPEQENRRPNGSDNTQHVGSFTGVCGYEPTLDAPFAKFTFGGSFLKSTPRQHTVLGRGGSVQDREQLVFYQPKPAAPFTDQHLEWDSGLAGTRSAIRGAPTNTTQLSNFSASTNHPIQMDDYGPIYPIWPTLMSWSRHSTTGMVEEPLESFDAIQNLDNWLWDFGNQQVLGVHDDRFLFSRDELYT